MEPFLAFIFSLIGLGCLALHFFWPVRRQPALMVRGATIERKLQQT